MSNKKPGKLFLKTSLRNKAEKKLPERAQAMLENKDGRTKY